MESPDFIRAVATAVEAAIEAADNETGGDPATSVWADVDGRCSFARQFKQHVATDARGRHKLELELDGEEYSVTLDDGNSLRLDVLRGTDIQLHSKKLAMYRTFADEMEQQGVNVGLNIGMYAR